MSKDRDNEETHETFKLDESSHEIETVPVDLDTKDEVDSVKLNQIEEMMNIMDHQGTESTLKGEDILLTE